MNYSDSILENKAVNFFKQLLYYIMIAVCLLLLVAVILVFVFNFRPYRVLSDSQYPSFKTGDMVVVKKQNEYKVGDILKFDMSSTPTTHRLVLIVKDDAGVTHYICHGDNVPNNDGKLVPYSEIIENIKGTKYEDVKNLNIQFQDVKAQNIEGKVVAVFNNYGTYFQFISDHKILLIVIVLGLWCFSYSLQVEQEIGKARRLM